MEDLIAQINDLKKESGSTKHECIVSAIEITVATEQLKEGDTIPSINQLAVELGYSRETVVKAYTELKEKGILDSKHGLGHFVSLHQKHSKTKVALVLYGFQAFQQTFYNTLRRSLGSTYDIDIFFHHNNQEVYKTILQNIKSKYHRYIVAPIQSSEMDKHLLSLPSNKLLIVDRYHYLNDKVAHITQEFETSLSVVFDSLEKQIKSFEKVIFYYKGKVDYPKEIKIAFDNFCHKANIQYMQYADYESVHLKKNCLYFTIGDADLWTLIKDAKSNEYTIGEDIGILSHNDSLVKEIIEGGITTFSTDFELMAEKAAKYIIDNKMIREIIPSKLIRRKSL